MGNRYRIRCSSLNSDSLSRLPIFTFHLVDDFDRIAVGVELGLSCPPHPVEFIGHFFDPLGWSLRKNGRPVPYVEQEQSTRREVVRRSSERRA